MFVCLFVRGADLRFNTLWQDSIRQTVFIVYASALAPLLILHVL